MTNEITTEMKRALQAAAQLPNLPTDLTYEYRIALSGEGPHAYDWSDKPHRLVYDLCRHIEALAERATRSEVTVKKLEWHSIERDRGYGQTDATGDWEADSIVGVYAINISTCGDMHAPWEVFGADDHKIGNFETLVEARAAAQADYEARIKSAIVGGAA